MERPGSVRALAGGLAAAFALAWVSAAWAQTLEYAVKANYLVRFAVFVEWPPDAFASTEAPVVICVAGRDPFGSTLTDAAAAHGARGRRIIARSIRTDEQARGCHMIYAGAGVAGDLIAGAARAGGVVLITDQAVSARRGAIHFVVAGGRVRFHIDNEQAERAGVTISSRLLSLALSVTGGAV